MRRTTIALAAVTTTALLAGGATLAIGASTADQIAPGTKVGGIEIGGLTPAAAEGRLERSLVAPLREPIVVERQGKRFSLSARESGLSADVKGTVDEAMRLSKEDGLLTRAVRTVTGGSADRSLDLEVETSHAAVVRFVDRVRRELDRKPIAATLEFDGGRPVLTAERPGMTVDRKRLASLVRDLAKTADRGPRLVPVRQQPATLTRAKLREEHGTVIVVNRSKHKLWLYKQLKVAKTYSVAVGMQGLDTPAGTYSITDKQVNPTWHVPKSAWAGDMAGKVVPPGPANPIKARWMGFFGGAGIHGTSDDASIGTSASHGCVRMHVSDVIDLYDRVPVGATIHVI